MIPPNDPNISSLGNIKKSGKENLDGEKESQAITSIFAAKPSPPYIYSFFDDSSIYIREGGSSGAQLQPPSTQEYVDDGYYQEGYA